MSKKIDLGVKPDNSNMVMPEQSTKSKKQEPYYPSLYVDKDLGNIGDAGEEVEATVTLKIKSINKSDNDDKKKPQFSFRFDVLNIEFGEDNGHISADANLDRKMKY
jgi:hypothetical protein